MRTHILFLIFLQMKAVDLCDSNVCITWNLSSHHLTLICKIDKLHLRVFFDDPHGNTQADCLPPYTNQCEAYYKNGSISINVVTKEVYFTMEGVIDHSLDGLWRCRHGMRREKAETYISIGNDKGPDASTFVYETQPLSITKRTTSRNSSTEIGLKNMSSDITRISSTMNTKSTINFKQDVTEENRELKEFVMMITQYGPLMGSIIIVLLFVSCKFWINRRYRRENSKLPGINAPSLQERQKTLPDSSEVHEIELDNSDYETINEHEMLPCPLVIDSIERLSTSSRKQQTSKRTSKSDSQSSSDRSYLDVIDDKIYLNPYQSMNLTGDSDNIHTYCLMTEECKYDIPSGSVQPDSNQHLSLEQHVSEASYYVKQIPKKGANSAINSRIVADFQDITSLEDRSENDLEKLSDYNHSNENITALKCDGELFHMSNILKGPNVMASFL